MNKRVLFLIAVISMIFVNGIFIVFGATQSPKIIINGETSSLSEEMIFQNDKIFIPLGSAGSELGYHVKWDADKREADVIKYDAEYLANIFHYSSSNLDRIQLFALNKEPADGPLSDFILTVDGVNKVFSWEGQDINRQPETSFIQEDKHIAIVTNTAAGTGIHGQKLYVVDKKSLEEIHVSDILDYLKNNIKFTSDNKGFTITAGERSWSLLYDELDESAMNKWAKANDKPNNLESYYKDMIERSVKFQSYYIANNETVTCLTAVKNLYTEQQAIGVFQFEYNFNGSSYEISNIDFTKFDNIKKLYEWIDSWNSLRMSKTSTCYLLN